MRGTELLVNQIIAARLDEAERARLARRAARTPVARRGPCPEPVKPDCLGALRPADRPA